jgi:hypothetical protein
MSLHDILTESVANWEVLGHPALLERFVLRNGKAFTPRKRIGRRYKAKECFANATNNILMNTKNIYVEGYAIHKDFPLPILHAWVTINGDDAMDMTLESPLDYEYYGVAFQREKLLSEIIRNRCYGLLDTGLINTKLIFEIDPELEEICNQVKHNRRSA